MNLIAESMKQETAAKELALVSRRRRNWGRLFLILIVLAGSALLLRHPLMLLAARWWVLNEQPAAADAAVVLGGSMDTRPFFAGEMYKKGLVPLVLVAQVRKGPAVLDGVIPLETDVSVGVLRKEGVPDSAIRRFGDGVTSTRDEAVALREWFKLHPVKKIMIATEPFNTRRTRYIFEHEFRGIDVQFVVPAIPMKQYDPLRWWESQEATINFQNEAMKFVYYWLHN